MRLGFHYHIPAYLKNGKIYTLSLQGLFIDSLAPHFQKVVLFLHSPTPAEEDTIDYAIQSPNIELVDLGPHYSIPVRLLLNRKIRARIKQRAGDIDLLLMRAPTPLLPLIVKDIREKIKFAYLVVGEIAVHVDGFKQNKWRKRIIKKYALWNERKQLEYAKYGLVFANSAVNYNNFNDVAKKAALVRTTTLKRSDFYVREDTCAGPPYSFLYTGRIDAGKGVLEIAEAIGRLNKEGVDCRWDIVGWATPGDDIMEQLQAVIKQWDIAGKVIFHGKKNVGEELFGYYKKADIFITASQVAEGFPRTIWEALAHSVPVISTAVGSISHFLADRHDVLLIKQHNPADIAEKVKELIQNPDLRQKLIKNGLETVSEVTLEIQGEKMSRIMADYIKNE